MHRNPSLGVLCLLRIATPTAKPAKFRGASSREGCVKNWGRRTPHYRDRQPQQSTFENCSPLGMSAPNLLIVGNTWCSSSFFVTCPGGILPLYPPQGQTTRWWVRQAPPPGALEWLELCATHNPARGRPALLRAHFSKSRLERQPTPLARPRPFPGKTSASAGHSD